MNSKIKIIILIIGSLSIFGGITAGTIIILNKNNDDETKVEDKDDDKDKTKEIEEDKKTIGDKKDEKQKSTTNLNEIGVVDDFEPISVLKQTHLRKYGKFIDKIYDLTSEKEEEKSFAKLNLRKFRTAITQIFGEIAGNRTNEANLIAKIINENGQKKFVINFGNKSGELDTLVIELKKLKEKPTYVEFIKLFKNKSNGISYRKRLNTVMHFLLGYNYKFRLKPNLKYTITTNDEHILSNEEAQTKYNEFMTELERRMGSTQYVNISLEHLVESIKTIFQSNKNPSRILFSKDIINPDIEGVDSNNIAKKYGYYGISSFHHRNGKVYINSLGDKYNDLTNWIAKIKSIAWQSRPSFKNFVNSFPYTRKSIKDIFVKVWKIAFGENKDAINFLNEGMHGKLIGSTTIDVDLENQIVDHSQSIATIAPSLSYSPILEDHTTLSVQKNNPKIGYWNLKDYKIKGFSNEVFDKKTSMLAKILIETNASIMGLSQIRGQRVVEKLVNKLNELDSTSSWKFIRSGYAAYDSQEALVSSSPNDAEFYGFIYKGNEFTIKPFEINKNDEITQYYGKIYENPKLINEFSNNKRTAFIRPPFGVQFVNKNGKDFTAVIGHHDSFGVESGPKTKGGNIEEAIPYNSGTFPNQGTQEVWESLHLIDVMKYFDSIDGENGDLVYMGNTNIKYDMTQINGQDRPSIFKPLIDEGFKPLVNPLDSNHKTSLGEVDYENSFDRIFVKSSMLPKNQGDSNWHNKFEKYNLGEIFTRSSNPLDPNTYIDSQDLATKKIDSSYWDLTQDKPKMKFIKELVSKNTPIYAEWDLSQSEIENSSPNWDTYLNSRKINKLKIPGKVEIPQELIDEVHEKINNKQTPVTLSSDDYDISKEEVKTEILTEIANIFSLNNTQKEYLAITTNSGTLVEETYTPISITITLSGGTSKTATFKIKKGNPIDRWKNSITFLEWKNALKNIANDSSLNNNEKYAKVVDFMVELGVVPHGSITSTYPKKRIFNLSSSTSMKYILDSSKEDELNTWEKFLTKLKELRPSWGENHKWETSYSGIRRKLTQLLSDVEDEFYVEPEIIEQPSEEVEVTPSVPVAPVVNPIESATVKSPQELIDEVHEKINNKQTPVTLSGNDYDISKEEVKTEILTEIANIFGLSNIQKGYLTIVTNSGTLVEETYTPISITITLSGGTSKTATFKIKKGNPIDRWKNSITFLEWKNALKNIANISLSNKLKYAKVVDFMVELGVVPHGDITSAYPKKRIFYLSSRSSMKHILESSKEDELNTWEKFLTKLKTLNNIWGGNAKQVYSYSEIRRKLTQLLSDVEDEFYVEPEIIEQPSEEVEVTPSVPVAPVVNPTESATPELSSSTVKSPQELIDEVHEKIDNKQTPVTLSGDDYDISKEEVKTEILTEIANVFGLNNTQKGYLAITTNSGTLVEETYTPISITITLSGGTSKTATFKIKKGNPIDRWKNSITFLEWKNAMKNIANNSLSNKLKYAKVVDFMVELGVSPSRKKGYTKGQIFKLTTNASMKDILDSSIEDELDTWEKFLIKLAETRPSWNNDSGSYLENRKGLTQLLFDVEDET